MPDDLNPYAPPSVTETENFSGVQGGWHVVEDGILTNGLAVLPDRCPLTSLPIEPSTRKRRQLFWTPVWARVLAIACLVLMNLLAGGGIIALVVILLLTRKKCLLVHGLDPGIKTTLFRETLAMVFLLLGAIALAVFSAINRTWPGVAGAVLLFLAFLVIAVRRGRKSIRIHSWNDGRFVVKGFHPDFLALLRETEGTSASSGPAQTPVA